MTLRIDLTTMTLKNGRGFDTVTEKTTDRWNHPDKVLILRRKGTLFYFLLLFTSFHKVNIIKDEFK